MARLTKKQQKQFKELKERAESAERQLGALDSFKFSLIEFLRGDIESIARSECESLLDDASINY